MESKCRFVYWWNGRRFTPDSSHCRSYAAFEDHIQAVSAFDILSEELQALKADRGRLFLGKPLVWT